MRNTFCAVVALLAFLFVAAPSDAAEREQVRVVDRAVTLSAHDRVRVEVACLRTRRACRGELVLGQQQLCGAQPVSNAACQRVIGRGRFRLAPGERRRVPVGRVAGPGAVSDSADHVDVVATPYLRGRRSFYPVGPRSRRLRLMAPAVVVRPVVGPTVTSVRRLHFSAEPLLVEAHVPLAVDAARVELAGTAAELHRDTFTGYVTARSSLAVGGERWHGQAPAGEAPPESGDRILTRIVACTRDRCTAAQERRLVGSDPSMGPICRLPRRTRLP